MMYCKYFDQKLTMFQSHVLFFRDQQERQNEKLSRSAKQNEKAQISEFVANAQKFDPRMKKFRDEQQKKKEMKKEYQQSEAEKKLAAEKLQKEEEERKVSVCLMCVFFVFDLF
jgi:hypothetical protein